MQSEPNTRAGIKPQSSQNSNQSSQNPNPIEPQSNQNPSQSNQNPDLGFWLGWGSIPVQEGLDSDWTGLGSDWTGV